MAKKKATKKAAKKAPAAEQPQPQAAQPGMMQPGMMQPGMMQPGMMQPGMDPAAMQGMQQPGMMPGMQGMQQPGMQQPGMQQPGMQQPGMQGMQQPGMMQNPMMQNPMMQNPMMQMMQMMQMMSGGMPAMGVDPAAMPFASGGQADGDLGLDAEIIRPATLADLVKTQEGVPLGSALDLLCLTEDGQSSLGGVPKGCTMTFVGPPGKGKTRTALAGLSRVAASGVKVGLVVAEEGFYNEVEESGRDDLCSRLCKIGMAATGLDEKKFVEQVLENVYVLEAPYHKHQSWDDFVTKYRYLVEKEEIEFVVIDSLNTLDPTKSRTADNLSALKTYNHEKGLTCVCIGQIRDTGQPVGGEALQHTADAVFLIEEMSLGSKDIAAKWGGNYRDKIDIIRAVKSVTTKTFPHPIRLARGEVTGELIVHEAQPEEYAVLPIED